MSHPTSHTAPDLSGYINLKLAALGQPISRATADPRFLEIAGPLLRNHYQKDLMLGDRLCPADARIQAFLDCYFKDVCPDKGVCPDGALRLPSRTFVLDRPGLARALSFPPEAHSFASPYLQSYRVAQGVLHNPKTDRRTTQGVFHVTEGGLPIPADKVAAPKGVFAALLKEALRPPQDVLTLPFTADQSDQVHLFAITAAAAGDLPGDRLRSAKDHGDSVLRARKLDQQPRFSREHFWQRRRSIVAGERRGIGCNALEWPQRLHHSRSAFAGVEEAGLRSSA